jgi:hypothetical protein
LYLLTRNYSGNGGRDDQQVAQPPPRLLKDWPPADVIAFERQGHWKKHCGYARSDRFCLRLSGGSIVITVQRFLGRTWEQNLEQNFHLV